MAADTFPELVSLLERGAPEGATELFHRYASRLTALAGRKLHALLWAKVDPEDVVQSALWSFISGAAEGEFQLRDWGGLWAILSVITVRKCHKQVKLFRTQKSDVTREQQPSPGGDSEQLWEGLSREPDPCDVAAMHDTVLELLRQLPADRRQVIELRLQGFTVAEIATQTGWAVRTVEKVLAKSREVLKKLYEQAGEKVA